ncbi:glycosyltransferase family 4 protein [Clostridium perfringens]|uniref:glycosyltransferase family 4 protein n=1 Tax=Clostridium perfringens TaxID=1502 RepID=UPI00210DFE4A|nr:glycosyltransferase family 4 protein [Clostridium perfringens]
MNIAFLCNNIFTDGGVQRVVTNVANLLSKNNNITILCVDNNLVIDRDKYGLFKCVKVLQCEYREMNRLEFLVNRMCRGINKVLGIFNHKFFNKIQFKVYHSKYLVDSVKSILIKNNYDIVIGCEGFYSIVLASIKDSLISKTIGWQHSSYDAYFKGELPYYKNREKLFSEYLNKLDENIVLTKYDKEQYKENLKVNCIVINNPISFECKKIKENNNKIMMSAGRLVYQKGFDMLIEAFSIFKSKDKDDWILNIFGEGEEKKNLESKIKELKMEDKIFIRPFTNNIREKMIESNIFISTSRNEGFGLVIIEALECGTPVISFDNSGPNEILKGYNCGILVEKNNILGIVNAMNKLAYNQSLRLDLSEKSKLRAKDFSKNNILNKWYETL